MPAPTLNELRQMVKDRTDVNLDAITLDSNLEDLGLESKDEADMLAHIEERYSVSVEASEVENVTTVGELYRLLQAKAQ